MCNQYNRIVILLMLLFSLSVLWGLITDYTFSSQTSTYTEISGGNVLGTTANDEQVFNAQPIGFNFLFNGIVYQNVSISCNGFLALGDEIATSNYAISTGVTNNVIVIMNRDIKSRTTGELSYVTSGVAPNREFTVQWNKYRRTPTQCASDTLNFQIKLHETTNLIEYCYGYCKTANYSVAATVQVGLRGAANTEYINRATSSSWTATVAGGSATATCTMNSTIVPPSGLIFSWTPPPVGVPPYPVINPYPANNETDLRLTTILSWQAGEGNPTGYKVFFGTDNPPTNVVNGISQTTTSYNPDPDLVYGMIYFWKIVPFNDYGDCADCLVWTFTAMPDPLVISYPFIENWDNAVIPLVPAIWTVFNTNGDDKTWLITDANPHSEPNTIRIEFNATMAMDDWFISPPMQLTAGINYQVRFFYKAQSPNYAEKMELKLGHSATPEAMFRQIWNNNDITNTAYVEALVPIYPDTTGVYYVGWHGYSDANRYQLYVDNIRVETFNPALPGPQNLTALTGNGSVVLAWHSPASRTLLGYKVYRNGVALTPVLISDTTYVDTTALWGTTYNYYTTATYYIPTGESVHSNTVNIMPDFFIPTGLTAITGNGSVVLNWTAPVPFAPAAYNIFRNWSFLITTPTNATTYIDTTATIGSNALYTISAVYTNPVGESESTNPVNLIPRFNPPTVLQATATTVAVNLTWTAPVPFAPIGYKVYRDSNLLNSTLITSISYSDNTGVPGQNYTYSVKAVYTGPTGESGPSNTVTSAIVDNDDPVIPIVETALIGNTPNPFKNQTVINFSLKNDAPVTIEIYNQKGQKIRTYDIGITKAGHHTIFWNGIDNNGSKASSGIYLYKMKSGNYSSTKKMILLK